MQRFIIEFEKTSHYSVEIEADNVDKAEEMAENYDCSGFDWGCGEILTNVEES